MKFGTGYAYWGTNWECDYLTLTKKVADIGFDILEIGADHLYDMSDQEIAALKKAGEENGIEFTTNSGPSKENDFSSADAGVREHALIYFKKVLQNMNKLGSKALVGAIYSFWPTDFVDTDKEAAWDRSIEGLKKLSKTAEELDIECALEVLNRNETYILTDCAESIEYVEKVGSDKITLLLDTYHMNIEEDNIYDAIRKAGKYLGHLHVGECNRKLPGMNNSINWPEIGKALRDIDYQKAVVMEPFILKGGQVGRDIRVWRDLSDQATPEQMDHYIKESLVFLKKCCLGIGGK
ncbi:sugar phosphate isomerase/epimerase family protein [Faecalicatena contorta]|uniref:D-tagatose 3-epimerase n=1 Tax=Faecalicatena contorta TaxID=39482 RepID=A0A316A042_9FIRM|nr:sugar phosphate isomerase/epimerase [Faecalicatena contorta]PWJ50510.1 D-tagatose 3-epimerase [Faecalicatena contorta]SUQ13918.1 D-tagatose 3-epimerase [Faecalicatena contorta]